MIPAVGPMTVGGQNPPGVRINGPTINGIKAKTNHKKVKTNHKKVKTNRKKVKTSPKKSGICSRARPSSTTQSLYGMLPMFLGGSGSS